MALLEKRAAAYEAAKEALKAMEADPSEANIKAADEAADAVAQLDELIEKSEAASSVIRGLREMTADEEPSGNQALTVGDHFIQSMKDGLSRLKAGRTTLSAPEFKDPDPNELPVLTGGPNGSLGAVLTEVDRTIVQGFRRPTVTSLFGQARMNGQAITYFVEGAREGNFTTVAEGGALPQINYALPTPKTDAVSKIGGFIKISDEMLEDLDYVVSEINGRLVYDVALAEENQVLFGNGTGTNLNGLVNRSNVQTTTTTAAKLADNIFGAMGKVSNATGLEADALVINPADYEGLRLAKDGNNQYYGGGYFAGQYGVGGFVEHPPVWGLRTVVTPAVAQGSPIVGAFKTAATVYTRGGLWIEATNANEDDFTNGLVTVRATKRIALAVRKPAAFVKFTISG